MNTETATPAVKNPFASFQQEGKPAFLVITKSGKSADVVCTLHLGKDSKEDVVELAVKRLNAATIIYPNQLVKLYYRTGSGAIEAVEA